MTPTNFDRPDEPVVDVDGLSTDWVSQALSREVRVLSCERIGTGQTAATYRLEVRAEGVPSTLVAKVAAGDESARRRVRGGVRNEVGFYAQVQPTVSIRVPRCWYAAATDDGLQFTLLLEDLSPRIPGVQANGCSIGQAEDALRNLAGLHGPRCNDETLFDLGFLRRSNAAGAAVLGATTLSAADVFLDRYGNHLSAADAETIRATAAAIESWLLLRPEPFGLLHGDYRLDNLMFEPEGNDVVAVDWQTLMIGPPARDVAYFLGTSLDVEARRVAERQLVAGYHRWLVGHGVQHYSAERCFEDYRLGQLQGPMITTIGAAYATAERTPQSDEMFLAMARRSCAAIRDLGSLTLI